MKHGERGPLLELFDSGAVEIQLVSGDSWIVKPTDLQHNEIGVLIEYARSTDSDVTFGGSFFVPWHQVRLITNP